MNELNQIKPNGNELNLCEILSKDLWRKILLQFVATELYRLLFVSKHFKSNVESTLEWNKYKKKYNIDKDTILKKTLSSIYAMSNLLEGKDPFVIKSKATVKNFRISSCIHSTSFMIFNDYCASLCNVENNSIVEKQMTRKEDGLNILTCDLVSKELWIVMTIYGSFDPNTHDCYLVFENGNRLRISCGDEKIISHAIGTLDWIVFIFHNEMDSFSGGCIWVPKKLIFDSKEKLDILNINECLQIKYQNKIYKKEDWRLIYCITDNSSCYILDRDRDDIIWCHSTFKNEIKTKEYKLDIGPQKEFEWRDFICFFGIVYLLSYQKDDSFILVIPVICGIKDAWKIIFPKPPFECYDDLNFTKPLLFNEHIFITSKNKTVIYYWDCMSWEKKQSPLIKYSMPNSRFHFLPHGVILDLQRNNTFEVTPDTSEVIKSHDINSFSFFDSHHENKTKITIGNNAREGDLHHTIVGFVCREDDSIVFADYSRKPEKKLDSMNYPFPDNADNADSIHDGVAITALEKLKLSKIFAIGIIILIIILLFVILFTVFYVIRSVLLS